MKPLKFDVYGRRVLVERSAGGWLAFYAGNEGKKRPATDIVIPDSLVETELAQYLADLFHESASRQHPEVKQID